MPVGERGFAAATPPPAPWHPGMPHASRMGRTVLGAAASPHPRRRPPVPQVPAEASAALVLLPAGIRLPPVGAAFSQAGPARPLVRVHREVLGAGTSYPSFIRIPGFSVQPHTWVSIRSGRGFLVSSPWCRSSSPPPPSSSLRTASAPASRTRCAPSMRTTPRGASAAPRSRSEIGRFPTGALFK